MDGACTNWAEEFFSRGHRMIECNPPVSHQAGISIQPFAFNFTGIPLDWRKGTR
jgi:hypothetical protein